MENNKPKYYNEVFNMKNHKKKIAITVILLLSLFLTSVYFIGLNPKTKKHTRATFVFNTYINDLPIALAGYK